MKPSTTSVNLSYIFILLLLSLIWGSSFILIKKALLSFTPVQVATARMSISFLAFLPVVIYNWKKIDWSLWRWFLLLGITGSGLPSFCFAIAQTEVSSSVAGVLNSLAPVFALIVGILFFKAKTGIVKIIGVCLGFLGAIVITLAKSEGLESQSSFYTLLIVLATLCYGTSVNIVEFRLKKVKSIFVSATSFVMVGPPALIYFIFSGSMGEIRQQPEWVLSSMSMLFLALVGTVIATIIFFDLTQKTSAVFSSSVAYLMPLVALGWGILDDESINAWQVLGMLVILVGVYLIKRGKNKQKSPDQL